MPSDWSDHPLIQRLLDADEPPDLSDKELALLEACLRQPLQPSRIQRERRRTGRSEYKERRRWLALILDYNRNRRAARSGDRSAGERGGSPQKEAGSLPKAPPQTPPAGPEDRRAAKREASRPPRLWTRTHCPNCGADGVEFVSFREFSRRAREQPHCRLDRGTVSRQVKRGRYWANAGRRVPWCPRCKQRTPDGRGVEQPVEAPHVDDYEITSEDNENALAWAQAVVRRWHEDFDVEFCRPDAADPQPGDELFQEAYAAILQAIQETRGSLTRDQAEKVAEKAIKQHIDANIRSTRRSRAISTSPAGRQTSRPATCAPVYGRFPQHRGSPNVSPALQGARPLPFR